MDLATIAHMAETWNVPIGLSDHTLGSVCAVVGVALGATLLEKHIVLSRDRPGPDTAFSLEPDEFKRMVDEIRIAERVTGRVRYGPTAAEQASLAFRRSLYVVEDIAEGGVFTQGNVRSIRPAGGLPPDAIQHVLGRRAATSIVRGTPLGWELIGGPSGEASE
jgi:sialic acid synthase SpsE